eukprot:GHVS01095698.1.p1 GENE.GHVS01095698.1~~GHVS01095698.1.p1  ORF type:complete len:256 (+),score=38.82 GHVS01095698.1:214-981(+)
MPGGGGGKPANNHRTSPPPPSDRGVGGSLLSRLLTFFFSPCSAPTSSSAGSSDIAASSPSCSLPPSKLHRPRRRRLLQHSAAGSDGYDSDKQGSSSPRVCSSSWEVTSSVSVPRGLTMFDQVDELPLQLAKADMLRTASFCMSDFGEPIIDIDTRAPPEISRCVSDDSFEDEPEKGVLQVLVSTVMQDGVLGLYQGLSLQLFKTVIAAAILYMVKERIHHATTKGFRGIFLFVKVLRLRYYGRRSFRSGGRHHQL